MMRTEQQIFDLIIKTAKDDDRIRAVILNGSRANPNTPRDIFQDFDIVYIVTELEPFKHNLEWIKRFGEMMILQLPDEMDDPPPGGWKGFTYLMQFMDGNRIDLSIYPLSRLEEMEKDSLSILLLDKDGIVAPFAPPNENVYLPKPPTAKSFADSCNEFWWVTPYVAKGLWRKEIIYARHILDEYVREQLMKMLNWRIGIKTGFLKNPGKLGKYYKDFLEPELWNLLLDTYSPAEYEKTWDALFGMCSLFRKVAIEIADQYQFDYPYGEVERVSAHLAHVRQLPRNAKEIY
jgi:aminoglycoside 6-adenylyltransferase